MRKRHISEFHKTTLANSGRAAGFGITEDRYGDEDMFGVGHTYQKQSPFEHKAKGEDGEVIIIKAGDAP